jgi:lincosamide nucleotidyltransferase A/C/D/E
MRAEEALAIVDALGRGALLVTGGWGVDALAQAESREHQDLDLAVEADSFDAALGTLIGRGFAPETDWLPVRLEVAGGPVAV